jgi:hypothetical protein
VNIGERVGIGPVDHNTVEVILMGSEVYILKNRKVELPCKESCIILMAPSPRRENDERGRGRLQLRGTIRPFSLLCLLFLMLTQIPVVSAHGGGGTLGLSRGTGIFVIFAGLVVLSGAILFKRTSHLSPTTALSGVFVGLIVITLGTILFDGLTPDPTYSASTIPFSRSWYPLLSLSTGLLITGVSFVVGWLRWPGKPRYTFLGILMGAWVAYPALIPGPASYTHPLGYALVLGTPVLVGYILWKDAWGVLRRVLRDPVARRFGLGVGSVVALFFMSTTGYFSFFLEEGGPTETTIVVLPVNYQLVQWPTLEVVLPQVPLMLALSIGIVTVVGLLSVLIGLNAALIARQWRVEERAGMTEGTAGTAAVVGSCTCGCCGPLVAKVAILAAGPSIAAPLYWIFVDTASPLSVLFIVASIGLFTGSLVHSVTAARHSNQSSAIVPAD